MKNSVATTVCYTHCNLADAKDPVPPVISRVLFMKSEDFNVFSPNYK